MAKHSIQINGQIISLLEPVVMGILNITNDSFYQSSRYETQARILEAAQRHIHEGAKIIDIGGYSSRPGAKDISIGEEIDRVMPAVELLHKNMPNVILSIDTFRSEVAQEVLKIKKVIINDISAGQDDEQMLDLVAQNRVPYIMMHKKGTPQRMHINPQYQDVASEVLRYLIDRTAICRKLNIQDIIWDVGFGFGKTIAHNFELLNQLERFNHFDIPVLAGISRKSMIWKTLESDPDNALNGTTALHMVCLQKGAKILRVHDVAAAVECVKLHNRLHAKA